jgi:heme-degrading monooxygenase HmoA
MPHTTEWAEFTLKPYATDAGLLEASAAMQRDFLDQQPGFISRQLLKLADRHYADLVTWRSQEAAHEAMGNAKHFAACGAYFGLMQVDAAPRTGQPVAAFGAAQAWGGLEFSHFRLRAGVTEAELQSAAREMAHGLYEGRSGFVEHAILQNGQGGYVDLVIADSAARAEALCQSWSSGHEPSGYAKACQRYLSLIEPDSVQMGFWDRVQDQ